MDKEKFIKLEYISLREEIKETKARIFKTMSFGLAIVPTSTIIGKMYEIEFLILTVPFLVVVVALVYLSENRALMRCGRYISNVIEPQINNHIGWEKWISDENKPDRRSVDRFLTYSFIILFFIYYIASSYLACNFISILHSSLSFLITMTAIYFVVGIIFIVFFIKNIEISTSAKKIN